MMPSTRFPDFESFFDRMSRQFDDASRMEWGLEGAGRPFSVDVSDHGDEYVVVADLPGFDREDIDLSLSERTLGIRARRDVESDVDEDSYVRRERRSESRSRNVHLPGDVDADGAAASYRNGVLTVTVPKATDAESGHRIDVE